MHTLWITIIITAAVVALMMAGLGIKMLCHKSDEFKKPCPNADPKTGHCAHCTCDKGKKHSTP